MSTNFFEDSHFLAWLNNSNTGGGGGGSTSTGSTTPEPNNTYTGTYDTKSNLFSASALAGYGNLLMTKNAALLKYTSDQAESLADVISANGASKIFVTGSRAIGVVGALFTAYDEFTDADGVTLGDAAKVGIGILTTFTPYGWAYGLIDLSTGIIFKTTLTDAIGNAIDGN